MTCREFAEFIADYLGGTLPEDSRASFERHLSRCDNCRAYLSNYEATLAMVQEAFADEEVDLPDDVPEDLIRAILNSRPH